MSLDLEQIMQDWPEPAEDVLARRITGHDGREWIQLRVDMGLLQMYPDGRPDGQRYRGLRSARHYLARELRLGRQPRAEDWQELLRELDQLNYRRLAYTSLAEQALRRREDGQACRELCCALRDVDACLEILRLIEEQHGSAAPVTGLVPQLIFHRARLLSRACLAQGLVDEAIEAAQHGASQLDELLSRAGMNPQQRRRQPAIRHLLRMAHHLRRQHGITLTLQERLQRAIEDDDFETAARLRDELQRRRASARSAPSPIPDDATPPDGGDEPV